jgi:ribose transport system permease protein
VARKSVNQATPSRPQQAAPSSSPSLQRRMSARAKTLLPNSYLVLVLAAVIVLGSILSPYFITGRNVNNVLTFGAVTAILAIGQFFVIVTGGIDLSVGSVVALSTVIVAILLEHGVPMGAAVVLTLLAGAVVGVCNGFMVVFMRLAPFIATLATLSIVQGLAYIIQSTTLIQISNNSFATVFFSGHVAGVPSPIVFFVIVTAIAAFVARYTTFGRHLYAIGGNREAARLSGLPVARDLMVTYTVSGLLAGLAGLLAAGQLLEGSSLIGQGYELDAIAAVVVGGASLFGGTGSPIGAVIGGFIIGIINNILNLLGISSQPQLVIKGLVIVIAVFFSSAGGVTRISAALSKLAAGSRRPPGGISQPPGTGRAEAVSSYSGQRS